MLPLSLLPNSFRLFCDVKLREEEPEMKPANQYRQIRGATATIIFGVLIFYIMQMAPSSLLPQIKQGLGLILQMFCAHTYYLLLIGRSVYGLGFGLHVPFIGSAIMKWYQGESRETMDAINALFPFVGTAIAFFTMAPLCTLFQGRWELSLSIWCLPLYFTMIIWSFFIREKDLPNFGNSDAPDEPGIYRELIRQKELLLLCCTFICDFICYSYIGVILPTYFFELGGLSSSLSNTLAALAFPAFGILGSVIGGKLNILFGRRKPILCVGQIGKFIGLVVSCMLYQNGFVYTFFGIALFGFFNGFWMPSMYCVPMDLDHMSATKVGASFALMTACGIGAGFFAPSLGGIFTQMFLLTSSISDPVLRHADALRQSLLLFSFTNILGLICCLSMRETGKNQKVI